MSRPRSLRRHIRDIFLILVASIALIGLYTLPRVYQLGGAIRDVLRRNYLSIETGQHMHAALRGLELAERDGHVRDALLDRQREFDHWIGVEDTNFTEIGEPKLVGDIAGMARKLFDELRGAPPDARHDGEFAALHAHIDDLIEMNRAAMFRADSRAIALGRRLTYQFAAAFILLLLASAILFLRVGWVLSKPLDELAQELRGISQRRTRVRLGPQSLTELEQVARSFNQMGEQIERYEQIDVERLLYQKNKTEAIIESLEDGVVLLAEDGTVTHTNEIASIIIGIDRSEALGSPFDDLSSNHHHYLQIRNALRKLVRTNGDLQRVEVPLHVRGRDHTYVLKPIPLRAGEKSSFGTLLILQDVTYLRDQDRARTNLVATLSQLDSSAPDPDHAGRSRPEGSAVSQMTTFLPLEAESVSIHRCDHVLEHEAGPRPFGGLRSFGRVCAAHSGSADSDDDCCSNHRRDCRALRCDRFR